MSSKRIDFVFLSTFLHKELYKLNSSNHVFLITTAVLAAQQGNNMPTMPTMYGEWAVMDDDVWLWEC